MWFSVVCTLIDNDTRHHSGQNVVDSGEHAPFTRVSIIGQTRQWVNNTNNAPSLNNKRGAD